MAMTERPETPVEQRFEYKAVELPRDAETLGDGGWRLAGTIEHRGTTQKLILERPVESPDANVGPFPWNTNEGD